MPLHLSVESDELPHWFYCILLCWTKKLAPLSLPIRFKTINCDLPLTFSRALGSVLFSELSSYWLLVINSLVFVLRHSIEMRPKSEMMGNGWLPRIGSMSLVYDLKIVQLSGLTNRTKIDDLTCSHHLQKQLFCFLPSSVLLSWSSKLPLATLSLIIKMDHCFSCFVHFRFIKFTPDNRPKKSTRFFGNTAQTTLF